MSGFMALVAVHRREFGSSASPMLAHRVRQRRRLSPTGVTSSGSTWRRSGTTTLGHEWPAAFLKDKFP